MPEYPIPNLLSKIEKALEPFAKRYDHGPDWTTGSYRVATGEFRVAAEALAELRAFRANPTGARQLKLETLEVVIQGIKEAENRSGDLAAWSKVDPAARVFYAARADVYKTARLELESLRPKEPTDA